MVWVETNWKISKGKYTNTTNGLQIWRSKFSSIISAAAETLQCKTILWINVRSYMSDVKSSDKINHYLTRIKYNIAARVALEIFAGSFWFRLPLTFLSFSTKSKTITPWTRECNRQHSVPGTQRWQKENVLTTKAKDVARRVLQSCGTTTEILENPSRKYFRDYLDLHYFWLICPTTISKTTGIPWYSGHGIITNICWAL